MTFDNFTFTRPRNNRVFLRRRSLLLKPRGVAPRGHVASGPTDVAGGVFLLPRARSIGGAFPMGPRDGIMRYFRLARCWHRGSRAIGGWRPGLARPGAQGCL